MELRELRTGEGGVRLSTALGKPIRITLMPSRLCHQLNRNLDSAELNRNIDCVPVSSTRIRLESGTWQAGYGRVGISEGVHAIVNIPRC
jgi:hypothetical protein